MKPKYNIYIYIQCDAPLAPTPIDNVDNPKHFHPFFEIVDIVDGGVPLTVDGRGGKNLSRTPAVDRPHNLPFISAKWDRGGGFHFRSIASRIVSNPYTRYPYGSLSPCGQGLRQFAHGNARFHGKF